jgi:hypothetical protein
MIMNLGKLLGAGKSFFGGKGSLAYRENKHIYLPKFNAAKNPFAPRAAESVEPVKMGGAVAKKVAEPVAVKAIKIFAPQAPKPVRAASGWTAHLNPFRSAELAEVPQKAVQVELSLDAVKVLQNDLSDADIEVVPVKSRTLSVEREKPVLTPVREAWDFSTSAS